MVAYNPGSRPGVQSTYGGGLGSVFQYGHANPYGPTLGLNQRPGQRPAASSSQQSSTAPRPESAALSYLTGTVQGQNAPYNQQAIDSQYSQASGMNAAAETAQNTQAAEQAAAGGASPTDPSYQAAQRQSMAMRQGANQRAMGQIQGQASQANQQAQQQAATTLLGSEDRRDALQQGFGAQAQQAALSYLYGGSGGNGNTRPNNFNYGQGLRPGPQFSI
jgi:hypothetical protein